MTVDGPLLATILSNYMNSFSLYPKSPLVGTKFPEDDDTDDRVTDVVFDWDATSCNGPVVNDGKIASTTSSVTASSLRTSPDIKMKADLKPETFFMFALPHHLKALTESQDTTISFDPSSSLCFHSFHGRTCLVSGNVWNLPVAHGKPQSFLADRPPLAKSIPALAEAVNSDINFQLSPNVFRGAADTYFLVSDFKFYFYEN